MRNDLHTCNDEYALWKPINWFPVRKRLRTSPKTAENTGREFWHAGCILI
jgi:hypothetical protein